MNGKIDTRAVGLDTGIAMIRWLTGAENLHYGLWDGLEPNAANLRAAQDAYTERLFALLPPAPARILDIGGGAGETARKLAERGYEVEIVVPSSFLASRCRANAPTALVHEMTFEAFETSRRFHVCLFSESFQYIPLDEGLPKALSVLQPAGEVLIADCFRTEAYKGRATDGPKAGGGHRLLAFQEMLARLPVDVISEEDVTRSVAPSIDVEQGFFNVLGHGLARVESELSAKRPRMRWLLSRLICLFVSERRRRALLERLMGTARNSQSFEIYNRYLILRLRARG
jgi:MPBQ/MSBQ methyltransferase